MFIARLLMQLLTADVHAAWLESTGMPMLRYTLSGVTNRRKRRDVTGEADLLSRIKNQAAACETVTGNSSIMSQLQVLSCVSPPHPTL